VAFITEVVGAAHRPPEVSKIVQEDREIAAKRAWIYMADYYSCHRERLRRNFCSRRGGTFWCCLYPSNPVQQRQLNAYRPAWAAPSDPDRWRCS